MMNDDQEKPKIVSKHFNEKLNCNNSLYSLSI